MKMLILATALLGATATVPAAAGYRCYWLGNNYICNDDQGNSSRCYWLGNNWVCN
jgi:hypothetical protein